MKRTYLLEGREFGPADADFQQILAHAYASGLRPLCGCNRAAPAELYVAKIASRASYEVRRMPKAGAKHASECDHYEPPPGLSGLAQVQGHAILEDLQNDTVELKLDFALSKISGRTLPTPKDTPADSVKSDGTKLTLRGLLHYLWHTAQLDKWYPAMQGKRSYGTMYKYINQAAMRKVAKSQQLSDMLYVPEPYDSTKEADIRSRRMLRLAQLANSAGSTTRLGLVIGELYEFRPAQFGYQAVFKGALDCPFRVNEDLYKRMMKHFDGALSMWDQHLTDSHMMLIGTFTVDAAGIPVLHEVAAMNVTQNWIPFESIYEKSLIDRLTEYKRVFWKCLRFNLPLTAHMANAVLTDTQSATALCVLPPGGTEEDQNELVNQIGSDDMPIWFWRAGEQEMPAFPKVAHESK
jgi:hypothetical protein